MELIVTYASTAWFTKNASVLFQHDSPLGSFNPVSLTMLMRHFGVAQHQSQELFSQAHSNDQSGAGEEDIPAWVWKFFQFFKALKSNPSATVQAAELATKRHNVATSFMGRQASYEPHPGGGPVQL